MSVSRWTGGNTFMTRLTMEGGKGRTAGDKQQAQQENSENGDHSARGKEKKGYLL